MVRTRISRWEKPIIVARAPAIYGRATSSDDYHSEPHSLPRRPTLSRLKAIVERTDTRAGRVFALTIQSLIVLSIVAFAIETLPNLSPAWRSGLRAFEAFSVVVFTVEYLLRLAVADRKMGYALSFFGLIDLFAILPFYVATSVDLRSLRAFRLLRLVRIFKLGRYNAAVRRFHHAFLIAREELVLFLSVTAILLYLSAVGIYYCENAAQPEVFASVFHSLWWSVSTLTTVGYGDIYPITTGGRIFTFFVLLVGLGIVAVPAGLVASALSKARELEATEFDRSS